MKVYLVGGAVRDKILGLPFKDRDWLVVGSNPATMISLGFKQVAKNFPVFLHPKTGEEYSLARIDRKTSLGHTGFICSFGPEITLEEDLYRRDFTMNAMAMDEFGKLYDPYGGLEDIKNRIIRHVSAAFDQDPLRVVRGARFYARFASIGFQIDKSTIDLMTRMSAQQEMQTLSIERIKLEFKQALSESRPDLFIHTLNTIGFLKNIIEYLGYISNYTIKQMCRLGQFRDPDLCLIRLLLDNRDYMYALKQISWNRACFKRCSAAIGIYRSQNGDSLYKILKKNRLLRDKNKLNCLLQDLHNIEVKTNMDFIKSIQKDIDLIKIEGVKDKKNIPEMEKKVVNSHFKRFIKDF